VTVLALFIASVSLSPGTALDAERGALCVGASDGALECLDPRTGSPRWRSEAASLPLAAAAGALLARGEETPPGSRLPLIVLDTASGRVRFSSIVNLPRGVSALAADDVSRSFRIEAWPADAGFAAVWTYRERVAPGVAPVDGAPPEKTLRGAFRVDVKAKRAEEADPESLAPPAGAAGWETDGLRAELHGGRGGPLTLERRDTRTGAARPDLVLSEKALLGLASVDGRHVVAIERVGGGGASDPEYRWSVFEVASGTRLAEWRRDVSARPFVVWKDRLIFVAPPEGREEAGRWIEEPLTVRGVDLRRGDPRWQRAIRDLEYRGALPPTP
jgi:hypothetical protein